MNTDLAHMRIISIFAQFITFWPSVFCEMSEDWMNPRKIVDVKEDATQSIFRDRCYPNYTTGTPCEYKNEVDFRIIVMTFNRPAFWEKCLRHILDLNTLRHHVKGEINQ